MLVYFLTAMLLLSLNCLKERSPYFMRYFHNNSTMLILMFQRKAVVCYDSCKFSQLILILWLLKIFLYKWSFSLIINSKPLGKHIFITRFSCFSRSFVLKWEQNQIWCYYYFFWDDIEFKFYNRKMDKGKIQKQKTRTQKYENLILHTNKCKMQAYINLHGTK